MERLYRNNMFLYLLMGFIVIVVLWLGQLVFSYIGYIHSFGPSAIYLRKGNKQGYEDLYLIWTCILSTEDLPENAQQLVYEYPILNDILIDSEGNPRYYFNWNNYGISNPAFPLVIGRDEIDRSKLSFMYTEEDLFYYRRILTGTGNIRTEARTIAAAAGTTGAKGLDIVEFEKAMEYLNTRGWDHASNKEYLPESDN